MASDTNHGPPSRGRDGARPRLPELAQLFEKLPPHAIEAEMCLLGSILIEPQVIGDALLVVRKGEDFYKPANGVIYDAMIELYDKHATVDIVQLNQLLADRDQLETIGGVAYLVELASSVPTAANVLHYARLVREKSMVRLLISAAGEILYQAYNSPDQAQTILDEAEQKIFRIAHQAEQSTIESMHDLIDEAIKMLETNEGRRITGVATGYNDLDEKTGGLQMGEMIIVAARPSMGKTALALNIAEQVAMAQLPVGIFSLEMGRQQLVHRMIAARANVDSQRLRRFMLGKQEFHQVYRACDELLGAPIFIDDTPGLTLLQLRAKARRMAAKHDVKLILIDYLQLMSAGGRVESRQLEVSEISRGVKALARELRIPVVALSQLNRAAEQRESHRPRMSDLRESGSLEQDADVVALLHREEYYHQNEPDWADRNPEKAGTAELIIAKQRNGPVGTVHFVWDSRTTRFRDHAGVHSSGGGFVEPKAPVSGVIVPGASGAGSSFSVRRPTGPVDNFRDGGGPDYDDELPV